ncbi:MAG: NAD(P)H-dependent oxidoreductase subunit E [Dethiobacteria bacterium]|jgi:NADH-quinone oxidoreductase subunit E
MEVKEIDQVMEKYGSDPADILGILMDIQEKERYLPREALDYLSQKLDLPMTRLYRMATFYEALSLKPLGRHQIHVCMGTACHVRGAARILDKLESQLSIKPGEVTPDLKFGLKTVNCVGACALGPVVQIDGEYHGNMSALKVERMLKKYNGLENKEAEK